VHTATEWKASKIDVDTSNERATFSFAEEIPATENAVLTIDFKGAINNAMAGFYRSKYKPTVTPSPGTAKDGDDYYMFSTQFEACDARRAFPCFDEPNLKATFELEIEIPEDQVALSNMPEKNTKMGRKNGLKVVSFEKTPAMSTYVWQLLPMSKYTY
jgi:aminopeptidase N